MRKRVNNTKILQALCLALFAVAIVLLTIVFVGKANADDISATGKEKELKDGGNIGFLINGTSFKTKEDDYTVTITAHYVVDNDFDFNYLSEPYTWKDMNGRDVTSGFAITKNADGFMVGYSSIADVLTKSLGGDVTIVNGDVADFTMTVTGSETISVDFSVFFGSISLSETSIIL